MKMILLPIEGAVVMGSLNRQRKCHGIFIKRSAFHRDDTVSRAGIPSLRTASARGDHQRDVIRPFVRAELADAFRDGCEHLLRPKPAKPPQVLPQALLAKLLLGVVDRFRHAIGVERHRIGRRESALFNRAIPVLEQPLTVGVGPRRSKVPSRGRRSAGGWPQFE